MRGCRVLRQPLYFYLGLNHVRKIGSRDALPQKQHPEEEIVKGTEKESTKEKKSLEEKRRRKQQPWKLTRSWKKAFIS